MSRRLGSKETIIPSKKTRMLSRSVGSDEVEAPGSLHLERPMEEVFLSEDLMKLVFSYLCLEDLCKAGMVRKCWRDITSNPGFWRVIDLEGRTLAVHKVRSLLQRHSGVYELRAGNTNFRIGDLPDILPHLTSLRSLELKKPGYDEQELESLSQLPQLTRLVLARSVGGGTAPESNLVFAQPAHAQQQPQQQDWRHLSSPCLKELELEGGFGKLVIHAPQLASLVVRGFSLSHLRLQEAVHLASMSILDSGKLGDHFLRGVLSLDSSPVHQLPSLARLRISDAAYLTDETLRMVGLHHTSLTSLQLEGCPALTATNLAPQGGFPSLLCLHVASCDMLSGSSLAASMLGMQSLESLSVCMCPQVTELRVQSSHLTAICLQGNRNLQELSLRCPRLSQVELSPPASGMAASSVLKHISLLSYSVERLQWAALPALEEVQLQCPNLLELDLSECSLLRDSVFESLGPGLGVGGLMVDTFSPGCPRLRLLKLSDCDGLRHATLSSPSLECLLLSHCQQLARVDLSCPSLSRLGLEECTVLDQVALATQRMTGMSLGTCPRLNCISIRSASLHTLDLRGCNSLQHLQLSCPSLLRMDATFCGTLPDSALQAVSRCPALQELTLAVCNSLTAGGLSVLSALNNLQCLDLSYMPLEDPRPVYAACLQLTSLTISNNYLLNPDCLRGLLPPLHQRHPTGPLCHLISLDISYCQVPSDVLKDLIVRGGRQLQQLTISGCAGVTDALMLDLHPPTGPPATALKLLSMMGGKALRHVYLGLMPGGLAEARGRAGQPGRGDCMGGQPPGRVAGSSGELAGGRVDGEDFREEGLLAVETVLPSLEELRIGLTGVRAVAIALPSLTNLQLFNCCEMRHLALDCPKLERLSLQACKRLPLESLERVLRGGCPCLKELDLQYYSGLDGTVMAQLQQACPTLKHVFITAPHRM